MDEADLAGHQPVAEVEKDAMASAGSGQPRRR